MKKIIVTLLATVVCLTLAACDDSSSNNTEVLSLVGEWEQSNKNSETNYQSATITDDTITVFWVSEDTKSLYWAGSYDNLNKTFTSNNDFEQTNSALLASGDDTKVFTVTDDEISYEVSALGTTTTVELLKISDDISKQSAEIESEEVVYEISYQNASTYKNSIGTVWVNAIWEVTNTGTEPLYLGSASCDLENTEGKLVKSLSMVSSYPQIVEPGGKGYYYEATTLDENSDANEVVLLPRVDAEKAKADNIVLETSEIDIYDDTYSGVKARGRVENTTSELQDMVYVAVVLFDENDKPAHVLFTIIMEELATGDKIGFEATALTMPDGFTSNNVSRYEVFAYPMQMQF